MKSTAGAFSTRPTNLWGLWSSTSALNVSWRLIFAPPYVLGYLAAHEGSHIVHMNHSPRFWKPTRRLFPETDRAEALAEDAWSGAASVRAVKG